MKIRDHNLEGNWNPIQVMMNVSCPGEVVNLTFNVTCEEGGGETRFIQAGTIGEQKGKILKLSFLISTFPVPLRNKARTL